MASKRAANQRALRNVIHLSSGDSKMALCQAAEEQFAAVGFEKASSRAIAERAGVHHAMVKYHFGSKEGLYEFASHNVVKRMTQYRLRRLDELERKAKGKPIGVKELVSLYVEDFFQGLNDPLSDGSLFLKFHGWFMAQPTRETSRIHLESGFEFRERFLKAFRKTLPHLTDRQLVYRIGSLIGIMILWRTDVGLLESHGVTSPRAAASNERDQEDLVEAVIEIGCNIFA